MSEKLGNTSGQRKPWALVAALAVAVVVVGYLAVGDPPATDETAGTIAPASRYRAEQIGADDVQLGDETIQKLMQTQLFDRLVRDKEFRDTFASDAFNDVLAALNAELNAGLRNELNSELNAGLRNELNSELNAGLRNELNSELNAGLRNELNSELNAGMRYAMNAELNAELRDVMMNAQLRDAMMNSGFRNALAAHALNSALNNEALNSQRR